MDYNRKRKISGPNSFQLDPSARQKVDNLFDKKFTFTKPAGQVWDLSPVLKNVNCKSTPWQIPELMEMKTDLNELKDKLSDKEIRLWHEHTSCMNIAGNVNAEIRHRIRPELCTQAWCKFYEILSSYQIVDFSAANFNSVHLCEAPGAFVTSLNHYLLSNGYIGTWTWIASTLNPYYEGNVIGQMIDDDRFVRETIDHWYFGEDNTGDLMDWTNLEGLVALVSQMAPVSLVTADGSIDCQDNPAEQERVVAQLQLCEAFAAILILSPGGSLVLKKFTMFEHESICLMFILNCLFEKVHVFKPATSKSGNSELYVVCCGFFGIDDVKQQFRDFIRPFFSTGGCLHSLCCIEDLPADFLMQHRQLCRKFTEFQRETIKHNLDHYPSVSQQYGIWLQNLKDYCAEMFISRYNIISIPAIYRIAPIRQVVRKKEKNKNITDRSHEQKHSKFLDTKRRQGTFNDRSKLYLLPWRQKVQQMETYDVDLSYIHRYQRTFQWKEEEEIEKCHCVRGKPFDKIMSSRFCDGMLIQRQQELYQNKQTSTYLLPPDIRGIVIRALSDMLVMSDKSEMPQDSESPPTYTLLIRPESSLLPDDNGAEILVNGCVVKIERSPEIHKLTNVIHLEDVTTTDQQERCCLELLAQKRLVDYVLDLLQRISKRNLAMIMISTCLTRFTTGVIYLLSQCFEQIGLLPQPGSQTLRQVLVCYNCRGVPQSVLKHLTWIQDNTMVKSDDQNSHLLEVIPFSILSADGSFMQFVTDSNETLLKSYITESVIAEVNATSSDVNS